MTILPNRSRRFLIEGDLWQQGPKRLPQSRNILRRGRPYLIEVDRIVDVDQEVTHARDLGPGNLRMQGAVLGGQPLNGFSDNHQLVQHGRLGFQIVIESVATRTGNEHSYE